MARNIDETKLERIKETTIQMLVSKGFGGASISEIARKAGVAEGYLYRFYKGKAELVNDLLFHSVNEIADKLEHLIDNQYSVNVIFERLVQTVFEIANLQPERIKFLYVLMHDYNFSIQDDQRQRILSLCSGVKAIGIASNDFRKNVTEEEIYLMGVIYPIQFINLRFKAFFNKTAIGKNEIEGVLQVIMNSLK